MTDHKRKVISYARFSSVNQTGNSSIQRQLALASEYCLRNDYELDTALSIQDEGLSAYKGKHITEGALGTFLDALKDGVIQFNQRPILLIEKVDRLTRLSISESQSLINDLLRYADIHEYEGNLHLTEESKDDLASVLLLAVKIDSANQYTKTLSERVKQGLSKKRADAVHVSPKPPQWVNKTPDGYKFNERVEIVRLILELRLQGLAFNKIALELNNQGFIKPNGSAWQTGSVSSICKNKAVIGICSTKYGDIKDVYPSVITEADFNEINKEKLNHFATGKKAPFEQNLFADLGKCHLCNSAVSRQTTESYVCSGRYHGNNCDNQSIPLKALEPAVIQIMFNQLEQNQIFSTTNESELQKLRLDLSKSEHEYNELEQYIDSQATVSSRLLIELDKRQKELEDLKGRINAQDSAIVSEFTELQVNYRDILSDKALRVKAKKLLRRLLDKVTYEKHDKLKFHVVLHFKTTSDALLIEVTGTQEKHKFGQGQRPISYHFTLMYFEKDIATSIAWHKASTTTIGFIRLSELEQYSDIEKNLCLEAFELERQSKKTS